MPQSSTASVEPESRRRRRLLVPALFAVVLMASAQIALPLSTGSQAGLTTFVVICLGVASYLFALLRGKTERTTAAFAVVAALSLIIEALGAHQGFIFGHYSYSDALRPQVFSVPLIVCLAWAAMAIPIREIARRLVRRPPLVWLMGGVLFVGWDLFLDPQMVAAGFWVWNDSDWWQGIPLHNYVGWFVVGSLICAVVDTILGASPSNRWSAGLYLWMVGMSTAGFLFPIAFDRPIVGVVGGVVTLPIAIWSLARKTPPWLTSQS